MQISRGKKTGAQKIILYAPEGWGKTTAASKMPEPIFIDTEGSTKMLDVVRLEADYFEWSNILKAVDYILEQSPGACQTLVIDTTDWAEQACINMLNTKHHTDNILTLDFGKGSQFVHAEFNKLLVKLDKLIEKGVNVVLLAHALMRKQELPEEMGAFDRWELKLQSKQVKAQLKEWADAVLFGNYRTLVVEDSKTKSKKAKGGKRVIYTEHTPTWDAKNRHGMPNMMDLNYDELNKYLFGDPVPVQKVKDPEPEPEPEPEKEEPEEDITKVAKTYTPDQVDARAKWTNGLKITPELKALMLEHNVTAWDVEAAVGALKNAPYSQDTSIENYDDAFQAKLVKSFSGMYKKIQKAWDSEEVPFEG